MKTLPYWTFHVGRYLEEIQGMSATEHGVYMRLLTHMWQGGGRALPDSDLLLASVVNLPENEWLECKEVMAHRFVVQGGKWYHPRLTEEWRRCYRQFLKMMKGKVTCHFENDINARKLQFVVE